MIAANALTIRHGTFQIENVSFQVPAGSYAVLMGKTGSGKTTILEAICGLLPIESGTLLLGDNDVTRLSPAERQVGFVPQDGALFEHLTVREHVAFALVIRRYSKRLIRDRVDELAQLLQLENLLDRRPAQLSGGEQQRVALGRALSFRPAVLCLDEPLSALDEQTRCDMIMLLRDVQAKTNVTTLHVTHLAGEAQQLADLHLSLEAGAVTAQSSQTAGTASKNED